MARSSVKAWFLLLLFFICGLVPWILVNAVYSEVPLFAQSVPEKYSIAAYITVAIQVGNIVTFAFVFTQSCCYIKPSIVVLVVFLLAHATCILSGTLWEKVAIIAGEPRSVALIAVSVLAGVVGSLSMVSMYPFAAHYGYKAIGALSTGSGCNGLVTSITAFIQQQTAGGDSQGTVLFAVLPFYLIIEGFIVLGTLAFLGLLLFPRAQEILLDHANPQGNNYKKLEDEATDTQAIHPILHGDTIQQTGEVKTGTLHVAGKIKSVLLFKVWIAFLNFLLAGTLPYSLSGFGEDLSKSLYFWAVVSGVAIQAIGRLVTLAFQWDAIALQTALQTPFGLFIFIVAFLPHSPDNTAWGYACIASYAVYNLVYGYTDTLTYQSVSSRLSDSQIEVGSRVLGVVNQIGAMLGSITGFLVVMLYFERH